MASVANLPNCRHRYVLFVSYLGNRYNGSQRLVAREERGTQDTIQEALECSLEPFLAKQKCRITAASRTDKGVHAFMNCFTLPLMDYSMPTEQMKRFMNCNLTQMRHDIIVNEVLLAPADFHPRKCAISREYNYRIAVINNHRASKLFATHSPADLTHKLPVTELYKVLPLPKLNLEKAHEVIGLLQGEHDFASFSLEQKQDDDTVRHVEISLNPTSNNMIDEEKSSQFCFYDIHFKSRAFLHNQVRRLVGSIVSFATYDKVKLKDIRYLLDNPSYRNWNSKILVAEPWGLFLKRINYDRESFQGTIKTHFDNSEELIDSIPGSGEPMLDEHELDEDQRITSKD